MRRRASQKKYYESKGREKKKASGKIYRESNNEKIKTYKEENKEKIKEYHKQYKQRNGKCDVCNKEMKQSSILRHKRAAH